MTLNYEHYSGVDLYSDGNIENDLLEIVKNYKEFEYDTVIAERRNWPVLYHLSHIRGNIVTWLDISKNDTVLEIGSGCGAITGFLADKAKSVTCVELSEKRSMINAYRNQARENIKILLGNFENIAQNLNEQYDYITLIGVLEYGAQYFSSENPYEMFLTLLQKHLKTNGKIIIAIENKFGLKYWAGCKEDHTARYFEGIEGYSHTTGVKTFSKHELEELLHKAGFTNYKFYYPYPDYKFPLTIYSDEYQPQEGDLDNNNLNMDSERLTLFDETKVFGEILKDGIFSLFSNSYLVVLEK